MKKYWSLLVVILLINNTGTSQTASDYYFNLRTGNYWIYQTNGSNGWAARTTIEEIIGTDTIDGNIFYKQKGTEILYSSPSDSLVFHVFWLRKDTNGNILIGAYSEEYATLDSAVIISPAQPFFSNGILQLGFALHNYDANNKRYLTDSVESINETVSTSTETYNNCIKVMELSQDSARNNVLREIIYYAKGIGEVQRIRDIPSSEVHTNSLSQYNIVTGLLKSNNNELPDKFNLDQNYPNPFNPSTTISFVINHQSFVTLKVYDVLGNEAAALVNEEKPAGKYNVVFNAGSLASGVYYYQLKAGEYTSSKKFVLLK